MSASVTMLASLRGGPGRLLSKRLRDRRSANRSDAAPVSRDVRDRASRWPGRACRSARFFPGGPGGSAVTYPDSRYSGGQSGTWPEHPSGPLPSVTPGWPPQPPGSVQPGRRSPRLSGPIRTGPTPTGPFPAAPHPSGPMPTHRAAPRAPGPAGPPPPPPPAASARPLRPGRGIARLVLPVVVLFLIGLGAAAVVGLWWQSTPRPTTTGALITAAGDVLGLLAGYGFVVLVALMSRLPPLEKGIGSDRLARWHAMGGRYVITLVSGHVPLIVWGYAVSAHVKVTSEVGALLTSYPDVLMATVAWFLLLGVAAFSARAARRRIRYETWYYAHLYTYLAIALAFSHQFADGPAFQTDPTAREAWSALYATVGALIVWYRVVTPLLSAARHRFTVQHVRPEAPGIVSVFISGRNLDRLRAEPGQFFRWRFLTRELWWQSHPYSLSAMPSPQQ